jgi:DNA (cytosine-5)-methyltransferase 1
MEDSHVGVPRMLNGLDIFSGIGGLTTALSPWVNPKAYCEIDRYPQAVLLSRMANLELPSAPIWDDVRTLSKGMLPVIDIIYGGFPCQDISLAGLGRGLAGERSGLVFEIFRLVKEIKPAFVFLENVPAIRTRGGERVVKELAALGYDCRWDCLSAYDVGAPHKRERWWLLAHNPNGGNESAYRGVPEWSITKPSGDSVIADSNGERLWDERERGTQGKTETDSFARDDGAKESVANTRCFDQPQEHEGDDTLDSERAKVWGREQFPARFRTGCGDQFGPDTRGDGPYYGRAEGSGIPSVVANTKGESKRESPNQTDPQPVKRRTWDEPFNSGWWEVEPAVGRVVDELPYRVDRLRSLGNSVAPQCAREAFERLLGLNR